MKIIVSLLRSVIIAVLLILHITFRWIRLLEKNIYIYNLQLTFSLYLFKRSKTENIFLWRAEISQITRWVQGLPRGPALVVNFSNVGDHWNSQLFRMQHVSIDKCPCYENYIICFTLIRFCTHTNSKANTWYSNVAIPV